MGGHVEERGAEQMPFRLLPAIVGDDVEVERGAAFLVAGREAEVENGAAGFVLAQTAEIEDAAAGVVVTGDSHVRGSLVGLHISRRSTFAEGSRVLIGPKEAAVLVGTLVAWKFSRTVKKTLKRRGRG
ncbi:MAG TPA: hypothetical protein VM573_08615 [Actinomycetota bacterium]|nr:hypothetical protein [Actinomycetota bacterium]